MSLWRNVRKLLIKAIDEQSTISEKACSKCKSYFEMKQVIICTSLKHTSDVASFFGISLDELMLIREKVYNIAREKGQKY